MHKVFIAGSIKIKHLDAKVKARIDNIIAKECDVLVGDADGADTSIQQYLWEHAVTHAVVYCSGPMPRNNVGSWPVRSVDTSYAPGSRAFYTAKDLQMAKDADFGLMIWDSQSTGTLSNVIELLLLQRKSVVYVNKLKAFKNVRDAKELEELVALMSDTAVKKADAKIRLFEKIDRLKQLQGDLFHA
ncbi:hypothetical protein WL80_07490 [Burkholderia ubonensis]|uniref:hypothetical protein n=1 Tax=Burkholderia ubonensis TaxID=101571 RepID=UPI00075BF203|nr:hypothetical protein [Burkholderia ubonensis]KWC46666.1 hypothetical protein WL52_17795 [Burkholderia ubonensis]KWE95639.1 hypothetical protein WL80_07490 [Burkholderia ubonensis]